MRTISWVIIAILLFSPRSFADNQSSSKVQWWLTTADGKHQLAEQPPVTFDKPLGHNSPVTFTVDDGRKFQTILGLGSSLEHSTCFNLSQLSPQRRAEVLERLFDPNKGIGINLTRICIGTPDFTSDPWYSYDDVPAGEKDPQLARFSIENDRRCILPILKQVRAAYPDVLFFASPWSPPGWMKSTGNMIGGRLLPENYEAYAQYFVRFIQAYRDEGIPVYAVTVQNEPGVDRNGGDPKWFYPSCRYTGAEERDFIKGHLGPALAKAGLPTKIWTYDHNFNVETSTDGPDPGLPYPRCVLSDPAAAPFVAGVAFHGYVGEPSGMSKFLSEFPHVPVHFTEGSVFGPKGGRLLVEYLRNGASSYNGWVTMLDDHGKPNNGPFPASRTCITLNRQKGDVTYHYDYYQYGHFFRFLHRGAARIETTGGDDKLAAVAVCNPDGQIATVVVNSGNQSRDIALRWHDAQIGAELPARSIATFCWPTTK